MIEKSAKSENDTNHNELGEKFLLNRLLLPFSTSTEN